MAVKVKDGEITRMPLLGLKKFGHSEKNELAGTMNENMRVVNRQLMILSYVVRNAWLSKMDP